jgi:eukaryotic-like serine/threonine-protein kinase
MTDRASAALSKGPGAPDALIGRVISDRFKVHGLIARGGMGKVYRAEQSPLGRVCAIKVLNPSYAGEHDPEFHKRFFLEASVASKLTHPNTVTIFDYGRTEDDIYYMAMEYLEGHTLHRAIREATQFPEERATHIARQICRALREAHSLGVIHRDLKPANIFLVEHGDETDFVKVLDFGLVKNVSGDGQGEDLTQAGLFMGSPKYMAPEQIRGDRVDARTDIYALGIILYEMITGKVPFDRANSVNILMAHVNEEAPSLREMNPKVDVSPALEEIIARCMAKDPDVRFRSMDEVLAALKRSSGGGLGPSVSGVASGEYRALSSSASDPQLPSPLGRSTEPPAGVTSLVPEPLVRSGSKGMLVAAVAGALGVAGIIGFVALRSADRRVSSTSAARAAVASAATSSPQALTAAIPAPAPVPPAAMAKMQVRSEPDGASVKENGVELCSSTPCDIVYRGADADPGREHKLTLARAGYRLETKTVTAADGAVTVKLTLAPGPIFRAPPKDTPAVPTGYKNDIPY